MSTIVVGLYPTEADVDRVTRDLTASGFDDYEIHRPAESDADFHDWLTDQGVPEGDAEHYVTGMRRGGSLVTLDTDDDRAAEAVAIMQRHERGLAPGAAGAVVGEPEDARTFARTAPRDDLMAGDERETVEVVQEDLDIGTREVERGGVRVRTTVTEQPVEDEIRVEHERVDVERRPADRPLSGAEADEAFRERTVAMTERDEEVVVGKRARVVEEVVLNKTVEESTERVRDTLRKTDVEVERTDDVLRTERDDYLTHHRDTLGRPERDYPQSEHAYRYGIDLAHHPENRGRSWNDIAPSAREQWERQNGATWDAYEPAVRYSYERAGRRHGAV